MNPFYLWQTRPEHLHLTKAAIHVWGAQLDCDSNTVERFEQTLSSDERARAARFRFPRDRQRFITARGILRDLLGKYLRIHPSDLRFSYTEFGKPEVAGACFNLSHSENRAVYAITRNCEVGIDIEHIREIETTQLARRFFSEREANALDAHPEAERLNAFFAVWARKEATIKAVGSGLYLGLSQFDVPASPALLNSPVSLTPDNLGIYALCDLPILGHEYRAALTVKGQNVTMSCYEY